MREKTQHWSDDELLRRVYGVVSEGAVAEAHPDAHLDECPECGAKWRELLSRRAAILSLAGSAGVSEERLQRQRQAVWARIERRPGLRFWQWAPGAAAAGMLAAGILLLHTPGFSPVPRPRPAVSAAAQISDAQLFNDVAVLSAPEAPRAAAPIEGLFEERRDTEEEVVF
jgi:hypothetical protein